MPRKPLDADEKKKRAFVIKTWKSRIHRLGLKLGEFCQGINMKQPQLSMYLSLRFIPSERILSKIENEILRLEKLKE